jgi:hypothetical protein
VTTRHVQRATDNFGVGISSPLGPRVDTALRREEEKKGSGGLVGTEAAHFPGLDDNESIVLADIEAVDNGDVGLDDPVPPPIAPGEVDGDPSSPDPSDSENTGSDSDRNRASSNDDVDDEETDDDGKNAHLGEQQIQHPDGDQQIQHPDDDQNADPMVAVDVRDVVPAAANGYYITQSRTLTFILKIEQKTDYKSRRYMVAVARLLDLKGRGSIATQAAMNGVLKFTRWVSPLENFPTNWLSIDRYIESALIPFTVGKFCASCSLNLKTNQAMCKLCGKPRRSCADKIEFDPADFIVEMFENPILGRSILEFEARRRALVDRDYINHHHESVVGRRALRYMLPNGEPNANAQQAVWPGDGKLRDLFIGTGITTLDPAEFCKHPKISLGTF